MGQVVVSALIAAVIAYLVVSFFSPKVNTKAIDEALQKAQNDVSTLRNEVTMLSARVGSIVTPDLSGYARKADVDGLSSQIASLRADIEALKHGGSSGNGSSGSSGGSGSGSLTVELSNSQVISTSDSTSPVGMSINAQVKNNTGSGKSVVLLVELKPLSPAMVEEAKIVTSDSRPRCKTSLSSWSNYVTGSVQKHPDISSVVTRIYWVSPEFYLENGASRTVWFDFDVRTTEVVTWQLGMRTL